MSEALQLQQDMVDFKESFLKEIKDVIDRTPLVIRPRKTMVDLDAETPGAEMLPPPLMPQIVSSGQPAANQNEAPSHMTIAAEESSDLMDLRSPVDDNANVSSGSLDVESLPAPVMGNELSASELIDDFFSSEQ